MPTNALVPVLMTCLFVLISLSASIFASKLPVVLRVIGAVCLAPVTLFCCYGFLATFEPLDPSVQMTWRVVYGLIGVSCIAAILRLSLASKQRRA